jgi:hypothetical protein
VCFQSSRPSRAARRGTDRTHGVGGQRRAGGAANAPRSLASMEMQEAHRAVPGVRRYAGDYSNAGARGVPTVAMRPIRRLTLAESEPSTDVAPVKSFRGKVKHANLLTISIRATRAVARRSSSRGVAQLLRRHLMISMPACELPSCPRPSDLSC